MVHQVDFWLEKGNEDSKGVLCGYYHCCLLLVLPMIPDMKDAESASIGRKC